MRDLKITLDGLCREHGMSEIIYVLAKLAQERAEAFGPGAVVDFAEVKRRLKLAADLIAN